MSLSTNCDPVTRNKHTNLAASIFMQRLLSVLQTISASRICVQKEVCRAPVTARQDVKLMASPPLKLSGNDSSLLASFIWRM